MSGWPTAPAGLASVAGACRTSLISVALVLVALSALPAGDAGAPLARRTEPPPARPGVRADSAGSGPAIQAEAAAENDNLEAVIETGRGDIVIEFLPKEAPRHVEYFIKQARAGAYDGTTFHRLFKYGLIQGGDPITKNPRMRAQYGTGGLNAGIPDEVNKYKHITGAVSAALSLDRSDPNEVKPGSSGAQFFIVVGPQPQLDAKFTVFAHVVEGMDVAVAICASPVNASNVAVERIEIKKVTVREKTPTVDQIKGMKLAFETSLGSFKAQLAPESAPNTARAFIRYAKSGLYDGVTFYRVSQRYFLEAGNFADWPADSPNRKRFFSVLPIQMEKSDLKQLRGTLSMRQAPEGATSTYFFIISKDNPALDGKHVPIGKVSEGLDVIDKIAQTDVDGDKPKQRIEIKKITIE